MRITWVEDDRATRQGGWRRPAQQNEPLAVLSFSHWWPPRSCFGRTNPLRRERGRPSCCSSPRGLEHTCTRVFDALASLHGECGASAGRSTSVCGSKQARVTRAQLESIPLVRGHEPLLTTWDLDSSPHANLSGYPSTYIKLLTPACCSSLGVNMV